MTSTSLTTRPQLELCEHVDKAVYGKRPHVSIIIPAYNHARFLVEAIQSVIDQVYDNYEVIVVDDGSQDNTREVVASFGSHIRYFWQENQGLSAARNTGIEAAKGELIGLLDADDLYEPDFLSTLVSILDAYPKADAVYCACQTVDVDNKPLPQQIGKVIPPDQFHDTLLNGGFFPPLCMFARKYCYERVGLFDTSFQGCADWDMWLRISQQFTVIGTDRVLARYRIVPGSMSSDPTHMVNDRFGVLRKHFGNEAIDAYEWSTIQRQAYGRSYLKIAIEYLQSHNAEQAHRYVGEAFNIYPELVSDFDVFYQLSWGEQPMGFRYNSQTTLDVRDNERLLIDLLDQIFDASGVSAELKSQRHYVYANAYLALGLISYGSHQFREARRLLLRAVAVDPVYGFKPHLLFTLVKSLLGTKLVSWLKGKTSAV